MQKLMKKIVRIVFTVLFLCIFSNIFAQKIGDKKIEEIQEFLIDFREAVRNQDRIVLKNYIYPLKITDQDYQENAVNRILNEQDTFGTDFEYSDKAFSIVIDSLFNQFIPINSEVRNIFNNPVEAKNALEKYEDNQIAVYVSENKIIIVLILAEKQIKLFFTEGMNYLNMN
jgi:hypothetical protein